MKARKRPPGRPRKLEDPVRMEATVERDQLAALKLLASARRVSKNDLVREALDAYLGADGGRP